MVIRAIAALNLMTIWNESECLTKKGTREAEKSCNETHSVVIGNASILKKRARRLIRMSIGVCYENNE